jgi:Rieske 2Fe-2S family protein
MRDEVVRSVLERLLSAIDDPQAHGPSRTTILDLDRYVRPDELAREEAILFKRRPIVVAHASSLVAHGSFVTDEIAGTPLLVVKDQDRVRVFVNACRHRGARLTQAPCGAAKLLTCPYHAWSYKLDGSLMRVPHEEVFGGDLDKSTLGLLELPSEVRHGLVWACLDASVKIDVAAFLGPTLEDDWAAFGLDRYVERGVQVHTRRANWKLVVDAFAEGYHLASLHSTSLARFFLETAILDDCAPHVRQVGARKSLREARDRTRACRVHGADASALLRAHTTVFYDVFPNTVLVFHPTWLTALTMIPEGVDRVRVVHRMLVSDDGTESQEKLAQSFAHIDGQVFAKEDLAIAESIQSTLASGAMRTMTLGGMEEGMRLFHAARDAALRDG